MTFHLSKVGFSQHYKLTPHPDLAAGCWIPLDSDTGPADQAQLCHHQARLRCAHTTKERCQVAVRT